MTNSNRGTSSPTLVGAKLSCLLSVLFFANSICAATGYISDRIGAPMRTGASNAHRIVSLAVPAGTQLEILSIDKASGFTKVKTRRGTEGWIRSQYITREPVAREKLRQAQANVASTNKKMRELREQFGQVTANHSDSQSQNRNLNNEVNALETQLSEIKRVSAGAIALDNENRKLTTLNERLRSEVESLIQEKNLIQDNIQQKWLLIGAGLVLGGLFLGMIIKARPRRSGWS
ncbi:MAG: TIGR04211 family SH3 domain-containing protein [Pseudomonadales bacterium]|nr:TIGR04211 family SH3 domain-containing protein [Pseudomonadales bacterium]